MDIYFIGNNILFNDSIKKATIEQCFEYLQNVKILGIDIETTKKYNKYGDIEGLDPYTSKIIMLQVGDLNRQYLIDTRVIDIKKLLPVLSDPSILKVGHNLLFEYKHIYHNYGIKLENLYDTQIAEQILFNGYPNKKYGLGNLIKYYFNINVDKETRLDFLTIGSNPFTLKHLMYGAEDIVYPLKIRDKQLQLAKEKDLLHCINFECKFIPVLGNIEYKGLNFNQSKWLQLYEKNLIIFNQKKEVLNKFVKQNYSASKFINKQLDLFNSDIKCNIQWTSSKQVVEFFKYLNACPQEVSKTTNKLSYTVNATIIKSSLNTLNKNQPEHIKQFIKDYISFKEYEQSCTTFGKDFLKYVNPITNRLHSDYRQIVTTGRMSSSNPNLQNIPADLEYRKCFDAPQGYKIINADYSGQETVVLANKSKEPNIINLINTGGDMHAFVTKAIHPELVNLSDEEIKTQHKDKRQVAKAAGFAIQYGGTGYTIAKNLGITEEEGNKVYDAYFKAFPNLKKYFDKVQKQAIKLGYILIDNLTGRKAYFLKPQNNKELHAIYKKALNYPIQGESGSITKLAGIYLTKWINENNYTFDEIAIVNLVHDEISVECKEDLAEIVAKAVEDSMYKAGAKWCKEVPLKAQAAIVDFWYH